MWIRYVRYGFSWFIAYLAIYVFANVVLSLTTYYAIPIWEFTFLEKMTYLLSIFAAAVLIAAVAPPLTLFMPLILFYYSTAPFSEMLLLVLTSQGIPTPLAVVLTSLAWYPASFGVFLAWGFGIFIGSVIGVRAFPGMHRIYAKLWKRLEGVI